MLFAGGPFPPVMKELDLPIMSNAACEREFRAAGYRENIANTMMCAGYSDGRKDTCDGKTEKKYAQKIIIRKIHIR